MCNHPIFNRCRAIWFCTSKSMFSAYFLKLVAYMRIKNDWIWTQNLSGTRLVDSATAIAISRRVKYDFLGTFILKHFQMSELHCFPNQRKTLFLVFLWKSESIFFWMFSNPGFWKKNGNHFLFQSVISAVSFKASAIFRRKPRIEDFSNQDFDNILVAVVEQLVIKRSWVRIPVDALFYVFFLSLSLFLSRVSNRSLKEVQYY